MSRRLAAESRDRGRVSRSGRGRRGSRQPRSARCWVATRQKPRTTSVAFEDLVRPERSSREVASDPRRERGRRRGWVGKVGKRAPTLETVATLVSPEASGKAIHTFMHFFAHFLLRNLRTRLALRHVSAVGRICIYAREEMQSRAPRQGQRRSLQERCL
jgi:hypothetical protein